MIGVFDSGLGGLTVVKELRQRIPEYPILYFGDTARTPYGSKSPEVIRGYAIEDAQFLVDRGAKIIIVACNSVSATAMPALREKFPKIRFYEVITPAAESAVNPPIPPLIKGGIENGLPPLGKGGIENGLPPLGKGGIENGLPPLGKGGIENGLPPLGKGGIKGGLCIGIVGTRATINSEAYTEAIHKLNPRIKVIQKACPLIVPMIEEGWHKSPELRSIIQTYLNVILDPGARSAIGDRIQSYINTLILGCTHYPIVKNVFQEIVGDEVKIIDCASAVVSKLIKDINEEPALRSICANNGDSKFFVSDITPHFQKIASEWLGKDIVLEKS